MLIYKKARHPAAFPFQEGWYLSDVLIHLFTEVIVSLVVFDVSVNECNTLLSIKQESVENRTIRNTVMSLLKNAITPANAVSCASKIKKFYQEQSLTENKLHQGLLIESIASVIGVNNSNVLAAKKKRKLDDNQLGQLTKKLREITFQVEMFHSHQRAKSEIQNILDFIVCNQAIKPSFETNDAVEFLNQMKSHRVSENIIFGTYFKVNHPHTKYYRQIRHDITKGQASFEEQPKSLQFLFEEELKLGDFKLECHQDVNDGFVDNEIFCEVVVNDRRIKINCFARDYMESQTPVISFLSAKVEGGEQEHEFVQEDAFGEFNGIPGSAEGKILLSFAACLIDWFTLINNKKFEKPKVKASDLNELALVLDI